jgi:hypothetical protein
MLAAMFGRAVVPLAVLAVLAVLAAACSGSNSGAPKPDLPKPDRAGNLLAPPSAFAAISDEKARSRALFAEAARVFVSPRCANCHPADDSPRQGDLHLRHDPPVVRGPKDHGVPGMECGTCHQDRNQEIPRVPGAPGWGLAPVEMAWLDRTPAQICAQLKDPTKNGGKTLAQVRTHVEQDPLVAWGWQPGADRIPAPGSPAELGALLQAWIDTGAECPP